MHMTSTRNTCFVVDSTYRKVEVKLIYVQSKQKRNSTLKPVVSESYLRSNLHQDCPALNVKNPMVGCINKNVKSDTTIARIQIDLDNKTTITNMC